MEGSLQINAHLALPLREVTVSFVRASGPGGQHVNTSATAVQLRFDVGASSLPPEVRHRLVRIAGSRISGAGVLVIDARCHRSQEDNRREALERLAVLLRRAARPVPVRRRTSVPKAARRRRLQDKRRRSRLKQQRRRDDFSE